MKSLKSKQLISIFVMLFLAVSSATAQHFKFGVMSDTQWKSSPDGKNPNTVAVNVIKHLNQEFIKHGVKFVIAVGDVTDNGSTLALDTRATFAQDLYNASIALVDERCKQELRG